MITDATATVYEQRHVRDHGLYRMSVDLSAGTEFYGQNRFALAVAQGKVKVSRVEFKDALINGLALNTLFLRRNMTGTMKAL